MQALVKQTRAALKVSNAREGWSLLAACVSSRSHPPGANPKLPKHLEPFVEGGELHYDINYRSPSDILWPPSPMQARFAGRMLRALDAAFAKAHLLKTLVQDHGFCVQDVRMSPDLMTAYIQWNAHEGHEAEVSYELRRRVGPIRRVLAQALRAKKVPRLEFRQDKPTAAEDEVDAAIAAARQQLLQEEADEKQFQLLLGHVQGQGRQDVDANLGNGEEHAAGRQRKPSAQLEADARQDKLQLRLLFEGMKDREELGEATPEDMQLRHLIDELMAQEQREAAASTGPQTGASEGHQEVALRTQVETMHAQHSASRLDLPDQQLLALVKQFRLESGGGTLSDAALRRILSKSMHAQFTEPA